jgi:nitroreductase/NAD-dependent dihydropyrimidine dehydrogenase PreA subunit
MTILRVEQTKCVQCGTCVAVCPVGSITMNESGPEEMNAESCISCGHCVAVCPTAALDNLQAPFENQATINNALSLDAQQASQFLRSRRSIRNYRPEQVPPEKLRQLLDMARFAPTAGNRQGISFMVISERKKLQQLAAVTLGWLEQETAAGRGSYSKSAAGQPVDEEKDIILRNAPHLIVALCSRDAGDFGRSSAGFVLAYAELFAPTIGLGTCWAGFLQYCAFSGYTPLLDILDVPADQMVAGVLMAGYPQFQYRRLVDRNSLKVSWS